MPRVQIYTKRNCPYCVSAKALLARKGVAYQEVEDACFVLEPLLEGARECVEAGGGATTF